MWPFLSSYNVSIIATPLDLGGSKHVSKSNQFSVKIVSNVFKGTIQRSTRTRAISVIFV